MTWITTYSGKRIHPLDPRPEDIGVMDIAHALSMKCRFNGHTKKFYSVAEHCVHVASKAKPEDALRALLHDAHEAYLVDLPSPLRNTPEFAHLSAAESRLDKAIAEKLRLPYPIKNLAIDVLDKRILVDEGQALINGGTEGWDIPQTGLGVRIECWSPEVARGKFYDAYLKYERWAAQLGGAA
jgi:hypothetical protein